MPNDTLTITLNGDIPLPLFAEAVVHFNALVKALSDELIGPDAIQWEVTHLEGGSADIGVRGQALERDDVETVVAAYGDIGQRMSMGSPLPYSHEVITHAQKITSVLNGHITSVRFKTDTVTVLIDEPVTAINAPTRKRTSLGTIRGTVAAIWDERPVKLGIRDQFNRMVYAYLDDNQVETARDVWRKRVSVSGMIRRDSETGKPVEVRDVTEIVILEDVPPDIHNEVRGLVPWHEGDELPEVIIRRMRDAE